MRACKSIIPFGVILAAIARMDQCGFRSHINRYDSYTQMSKRLLQPSGPPEAFSDIFHRALSIEVFVICFCFLVDRHGAREPLFYIQRESFDAFQRFKQCFSPGAP